LFSRTVTQKEQEAVEQAVGFSLHRYTPEECQEWRAKLYQIHDEQGALRPELRPNGLFPEEARFITNEQLLCMLDFVYWAERYAYIVNQFGDKVLFKANIAQSIYIDVLAEMEEMGIALMIQALKARQLGITTISELIIAWRSTFYPVTAVVASSDPDKSQKMAKIMDYVWDNMPFYLLPPRMPWRRARDTKAVRYRAGELVEFPQIDSAISIQWGNQTTGICRGTTPKLAHLSEVAEFERPEELIDASLIRAMHENPKMFLCLESTAMGKDNWWWRTWNFNVENWPGAARLYPLFLPWYVGTDLYPTETYLRKNPLPLDWDIPEYVLKHASNAKQFVKDNPLLRKHLGAEWEMSKEQMWYYHVNRKEHVAKGTLTDWYKELPSNPDEAFQVSGTSILDAELIAEYRDSCARPLGAFLVDGPEVPSQLKFSHLNVNMIKDLPPIPCTRDYCLRPISIERYPMIDYENKVLVWEWPESNEEYAVGVDTGEGVGGDSTVIEVIRKGSPDRHAAQVAEFSSNKANAFEAWPLVWALANFYSVPVNGEMRHAKVVVECEKNGESINMELRKRGWPGSAFHIRHRPGRRQINLAAEKLLGWKTDSLTRPIMLDFLLTAIKEKWLDLNSPRLIDELDSLWLNEKRGSRIEHRPGHHDDRVFALGIALYSIHWNTIYRSASPLYEERQRIERERSQYPTYRAGIQEIDRLGPKDKHIRW
jgi:hypothetical protein